MGEKTMNTALKTLAAAVVSGSVAFGVSAEPVRNIVLVHGAFADGSGWRGVYDELTARGYAVSIVQNPLTSFADDVAATRRVLNRQDGPVILVGHSYAGSIITEVGINPKVVAFALGLPTLMSGTGALPLAAKGSDRSMIDR
jgi:pimeloyl-ACP methyl ester carboxylesterase